MSENEKANYLYKVKPVMPVFHTEYYVVAPGMDKACELVTKAENESGGDCLGIRTVEALGSANGNAPMFLAYDPHALFRDASK